METYTLISVLMFLKNQQEDKYRGIETIFQIIEDKRIPEEQKIEIVLMALRRLGLEEEYAYEPVDLISDEQESEKRIKRFMPYRVDQFRIPIMDSIISYECVLN